MYYKFIFAYFIFNLIINITIAGGKNKPLPSYIEKCHRGDNECIETAAKYLLENYPEGNEDLHIESLDPLKVKKLDMLHDKEGKVKIDWKLIDANFYGFSNSTISITGFDADIEKSNVTIKIFMPKFVCDSNYKLRLKFHKRKSHGAGRCRLEFENFEFIVNFGLKIRANDKGKQFLVVDQLNVDFEMTNCVSDFGDLFDGDTDLSRFENQYFTKNWREFIDDLRVVTVPAWERIYTQFLNTMFKKRTIDTLFLDNIE